MNLEPCDLENYTQVTREQFELFLNEFAPNHYRTAHSGGENYKDDKRKTIATNILEKGYFVLNKFIGKGEKNGNNIEV